MHNIRLLCTSVNALNNKDIIKQILRAIFLNNNINFDKYTTLLYQLITHFFSKHC